jgi:hypothetical protein
MYIFRQFIFIQKMLNHVIYWGNYKYFKKHVPKKNLSKNPFCEKIKMSTKNMWLNHLPPLTHLIMIAPL